LDDIDQIIQDCRDNKRLGQEKLYRKFYPVLFLLCRRFFANETDALEALQDGMLKVYKNIRLFNPLKGSLLTWIYIIVRNAAIDKYKTKKSWQVIELLDEFQADDHENPLKKLEWKDVYKFLDLLAPATRVVCTLHYLEGYSVMEISGKIGIKSGTVKWHLSETRKKLKPYFQRYYYHKNIK
jgi:RNA polymerase sigma-70 factor (ECF subfamily)